MDKFYKVRKGFKYTGNESLSNLDYWYGPWESIEEFKTELLGENYNISNELQLLNLRVTPGFTIGVYTDSSKKKVKEKWFLKNLDGDLELIDKIEEYKLLLKLFYATIETEGEHANLIKIVYEIGGKGLLPKVSISGTSVLSSSVNFDTEETIYIDVSTPKIYYFRISVSDVLGTYFDSNGINTIIEVAWGDIVVKTTNTSYVTNVLPLQTSYEGKPIGIEVEYNTEKITDISICLFGDGEKKYTFSNITLNNGKISEIILLPTGDYYGHNNSICVEYSDDGVLKRKEIFLFNILLPGEFDLIFPEGIPQLGYSGSSLPITVNLQYGGKPLNESEIVRSKIVRITLDNTDPNNNKMEFEINVNNTILLSYLLPIINFLGLESITKTIRIELLDTNIFTTSNLEIKEVTTPQIPIGTYYFNSSLNKIIEPHFNYPFFNNLTIPVSGQSLLWNSLKEETVLRIPSPHFNIDFNINYSWSIDNLPLIIINLNDKNLLTIGQLKITSDLFELNGKTYQTNGLCLPKDNLSVHIGFGYQRAFDSNTYYSCIFINGEIAFCNESYQNPINGQVEIRFNNSFLLEELCLSLTASPTSLINCVNSAGSALNEYKLILGSQYDIFYYNWITTLPLNYTIPQGENLLKLLLIPFSEPEDASSDPWWTSLRSSLSTFGSNIKATDSKRDFKQFLFVNFGKVNHKTKAGIINVKELFEFLKSDKELKKLDKLCGVICKYKFVKGAEVTFDNNKYCIVQVQGTSTLAYPVPNFQFTFIKEVNGIFSLDNEVNLSYLSPVLGNIENNEDLEFETLTVSGETNLVAKADSMDSAHLNNTPTCVYFNSLVKTLGRHPGNEFNFNKFDLNFSDAIVGCPILLEIDSNEKQNVGKNILTDNIQYDSYGTFMFNTGKSAKDMGLADNDHKMFSLEGLSNEDSEIKGAAGLFTLPKGDDERSININSAFNKLELIYDEDVTIDDSELTVEEKTNIIEYLINDESFESRSTIDDDDIIDVENHWNDYALPILRMWLFINRAEGVNPNDNFPKYFDKVFDKNYAIIYYINLLLFGQADNLGKNMMIDCKLGDTIWYIRPYDLDSEFGLTNNGFDDFPVYANISRLHFLERFVNTTYTKIAALPEDTFNKYNSLSSLLWTKFWAAFKTDIIAYYANLRKYYITPERLIEIGKTLVNNLISKEQYNIDFSLKHLGTEFSYLNKGGRFLNYQDWIEKRFMYVDSYFSYFTAKYDLTGYNGFNWTINKTLVPIFYEANYLKPATRYGYEDWTNDGVMSSNMLYVFQVVPEAILSMSPMWANITSDFNNGLYKNIQKYSGQYNDFIFNESNLFNLKEIEILLNTEYNIQSKILYVPKSVKKLKLLNLSNDSNATEFLHIYSDGGLEELYIVNCNISLLSLDGLVKLKVLEITSSSDINYTYINSLTLKDLRLSKLKIGGFTKIGTLNIANQITIDNVINLSGISCESLIFSDSTVEELYLDLVYNFNGEICSGYEFKNGNLFKTQTSVISEPLNKRAYNVLRKNGNDYEPLFLNRNNCRRISPSIGTNSFDSLDLSNCSNLKKFSCIGYTKLKELKLPTSVKCLNLQYCKNLISLNCDESLDLNMYFDFNGFTGLYCNSNYGVLGYNYAPSNASIGSLEFCWYQVNNLGTTSFNLLGCDSVTKIKNLTNSSVSNFTGAYFVAGCRNLELFEDCELTFTSLIRSFKMTNSLLDFPSSDFTFNILRNASALAAFNDTGVNIEQVFLALGSLEINASNMFSGVLIKSNIGSSSNIITLNWTNCSGLFSERTWSTVVDASLVSALGRDYEYICLNHDTYAANSFTHGSSTYLVYIKLPNATNVYRAFMSLNIIIGNPDTIFKTTRSDLKQLNLTNAAGFLANTKLNNLIDFSKCTNLTNVSFCYSTPIFSGQNLILITTDKLINNCKLPNSITNVEGLFDGTVLDNFDVNGIFSNLTKVTNARSCFRDTKCNCSGNPFGTLTSSSIDISSMFGGTNSNYYSGTISNLDWISENMITGNISLRRYNDNTLIESVGVFEGKTINNFLTIDGEGSTLKRLFRNSNILSFSLNNLNQEFSIIGTNSSQIFEGATIGGTTENKPFNLKINDNVTNLSKGFMNSSIGVLDLDIRNTNHISNLSYFLSGATGTVRLFDNQNENYVFFPSLTDISHIFDMSPLNATNNTPRRGLGLNFLPSYLFKNATSLTNIDYFYKDVYPSRATEFEFTNCINIISMNYAYANSAITSIPEFNSNLNSLVSIKGAFRKVTLSGNNLFNINAPILTNADEVFALSTSDTNIVISISECTKLKNINAFSTNSNIDLSLNDSFNEISALLPNIANTTAGDLIIRGSGEEIERQNTILLTLASNIDWASIDTFRLKTYLTNSYYSLAGDTIFKYLVV